MNTHFSLPAPGPITTPARPWRAASVRETPPESLPACGRILLQALTLEAPMVGAESARLALRCDEETLLDWILSGEIEWAFDLRRRHSRRCYLRILTESVVVKQKRPGTAAGRPRLSPPAFPFQDIFDSLFPHRRPLLPSAELAGTWGCGLSHFHNLVRDGLLGVVAQSGTGRGAFQIPRENAAQFMRTRRIQ